MTLIAFHGKLGAGKNESSKQTIAILSKQMVFEEKAFAAPIKEIVAALMDTTVLDQYDEKTKNTHVTICTSDRRVLHFDPSLAARILEQKGKGDARDNEMILTKILIEVPDSGVAHGHISATYGTLQQHVGTMLKPIYGDDIWLDMATFGWKEHLNWIFTDMRFPNEKLAIEKMGGTCIKIVGDPKGVRAKSKRNLNHVSETALDHLTDEQWDLVIENSKDDIDGLKSKLQEFYISIGVSK